MDGKWSSRGFHILVKISSLPLDLALILSMGKMLYIFRCHCATVGGLSVIQLNRIHFLARTNSFWRRITLEEFRDMVRSGRLSRNRPGFFAILHLNILSISLEIEDQNLEIAGQSQKQCI